MEKYEKVEEISETARSLLIFCQICDKMIVVVLSLVEKEGRGDRHEESKF